MKRFVRRHRILVVASTVVFGALIAGFGVASYGLIEEARRAREVQQVADFQAEQIGDIEPALMGGTLRKLLLAATPESERPALELTLARVNLTDIALDLLDESIFERTRSAIDTQFDDQPIVQAQLLGTLASTLHTLGSTPEAVEPLERALTIRREHLGDDDPRTLTSIAILGAIFKAQGRFDEARQCMEEALEGRRRVLGDEHPETIEAINALGGLAQAQRDLDEAETYFEEALERSGALGDEHPETIKTMNNLAMLRRQQGRLDEAETILRDALERARRSLGEDARGTLITTNNLGGTLTLKRKLDEAIPYFREVLRIRRRLLGDDHQDTLTSMNNLGVVLERRGVQEESEALHREALKGRLHLLGPYHLETLSSVNNLASALRGQARHGEAEVYYRQAVDGLRAMHGADHPYTVMATSNLGSVLNAQEKYDESSTLLEPSEPVARKIWTGSNVHRLGVLLLHLGTAQARSGDHVQGEASLLEAHGMLSRGPSVDLTRSAVEELVALYDRWHEAEPAAGHDASAARWREELSTLALEKTKP